MATPRDSWQRELMAQHALRIPTSVDWPDPLLETEGYLVDTMPHEPIGVVEEVDVDNHGCPVALVVSCGWFGRHRCRIGVDQVHDVCHESRQVRVRRGALSNASKLDQS